MSNAERLHDRFVRLCEIRSPSGEEREIADAVTAELRRLGIEVSEDGSAEEAGAGAGNLLARLPGRSDEWIMFAAHLDTVPHEGRVEVVHGDGIYRSAGETILGADNKAAVAVLLELAAAHAGDPPDVGVELLFTVAEEVALRGAKAFDVSTLRSEVGFVIDHASPIGEVITASPSYQRVDAEFEGTEAHAGIRPEDGHSAIAAAAAAIAAMELGRLDPETTANVGVIAGGTSANVVPGACRIEAEARSIDPGARPRWPGGCRRPAPGRRASTAAISTCGSPSCSGATASPPPRGLWRWPRPGSGAAAGSPEESRAGVAATQTP